MEIHHAVAYQPMPEILSLLVLSSWYLIIFGLDERYRMNVPGTLNGNWGWRLVPEQLDTALIDKIAEMTITYGRA